MSYSLEQLPSPEEDDDRSEAGAHRTRHPQWEGELMSYPNSEPEPDPTASLSASDADNREEN